MAKTGKHQSYNPWPLGEIPEHLRRPEIKQLKAAGYKINDDRDAIGIFEQKVATFTGAKYGIAVDSCSHGLFLCLVYLKDYYKLSTFNVIIPENTYVSVPMQILHAGFNIEFANIKWEGIYQIKPFNLWDAAVRWKRGMYIPGSTMVISFQYKKRIPIGKGGIVITDNKDLADAIRLMRYDGRDLTTSYGTKKHVKMVGYHYYMTPDDAARGILLMDQIKEEGDSATWKNYPKLKYL